MRRAEPYHLHVPIVMKSGIVNLLEPTGAVQACNGIALPVYNTYCFSTACLISVKSGGTRTKHRLEFTLMMEAACSSETVLHFYLTHVLVTAQKLMSIGTVVCVLEIRFFLCYGSMFQVCGTG